MSEKRGYLLPDEPETAVIRCVRVYVPDRPEYRRALLGSLDYLGKWLAWDRDSERGGLAAAALWKQANILTLRYWQRSDCVDHGQEDEELCNCCCGGGHGGPSWLPTLPPADKPGPDDLKSGQEGARRVDDLVNPPEGFQTRQEYDAYKCKAARSMAVDLRRTIYNIGSIGGLIDVVTVGIFAGTIGGNAVAGAVLGLFSMGLAIGAAAAVVVAALVTLAAVSFGAFVYFGIVADNIDVDQLSCDLYASTTEQEARTAIETAVGSATAAAGIAALDNAETFTAALNALIKAVTVAPVVGALFAFVQWVEDAAAAGLIDNFDCTGCGAAAAVGYIVVNDDASYQPAYLAGNQFAQGAALTTDSLVNGGVEMWGAQVNQSSWWGPIDAMRIYNDGAIGIDVTPEVDSYVRFRHSRTSDFGGAAEFRIDQGGANIYAQSYNTARIVPQEVVDGFLLQAGVTYRLVFLATSTKNWYVTGFELVAA